MTALGVVALVVGILAVTALMFVLLMIPISRRLKRMGAEMEAEMGPGERAETVRGLGLESRGAKQWRGTGRLLLTGDDLRFRMMVPDRETVIPLASVTDVGTEKTWLGKWVGRRLFRVRWRTPEGGEDAMAWEVKDLEAWVAAVREAAEGPR